MSKISEFGRYRTLQGTRTKGPRTTDTKASRDSLRVPNKDRDQGTRVGAKGNHIDLLTRDQSRDLSRDLGQGFNIYIGREVIRGYFPTLGKV